jgi:outer membrane lipoprotein-sorting protein
MILGDVLRLTAAAALTACVAAPAAAQGVPYPQPRPANLTVNPSPAPVPSPMPAAPVALPAAAAPTVPAAPASAPDGAIAATTTPSSGVTPAALPADAPPPGGATVAVAPGESPAATEPPPLDLTQPQSLPQANGVVAVPGMEVAAVNPVDTPAEEKTLDKVNSYFNGIRTLVGNFTQIGPDGSKADGKFFLMKPGKVRFYYQQPSTTDIIADGKSLVVRDRKLATQDVYPLGQTPLKFLLDNHLDLARDSKVVGVYEEPGLVSVALEEETTFGGKARVLLVFASEDQVHYELKQWTITDAQGLDTTVIVSELDPSTKPADKLFEVDYTRDIKRN